MKILYLITTVGHGKGGHFHSLNTIANEMGKTNDIYVVNIGVQPSSVLDTHNYNLEFVDFTGFNIVSVYLKLKRIVKKLQPDAVHGFDVESFVFARIFSKQLKQQSFLNKCGGPNPKKYYPIADNLVLFSQENLNYFQLNKKYQSTQFALIPNRVKEVVVDNNRVEKFYKTYQKPSLSILRISRIGNHYYTSILQCINLLSWLKSKGLDVKLILIGTIQSEKIYNQILAYITSKDLIDNVIVETSDYYTHNASELLSLGDVVVGTGRNFMEAACLNKLLLVPYKESDYPLFVTDNNFDQVFTTNFSPRTHVDNYNEAENLNNILTAINETKISNSRLWFDENFSVISGAQKYLDLYKKSQNIGKTKVIDTFVNLLYTLKTFITK